MSVVGSLEDLSFPDILQVVHLSRQSGTLILSGAEGERRVRFRDGLICDATLGSSGPSLDDLLVQRGLVAPAALEPARLRRAEKGGSLATALIALGALSQETLDSLVREELRSTVRALVLMQEGEFRFETEGASPLESEGAEDSGSSPLRKGLGPDAILSDLPSGAAPRWPADPPPLQNGVPRRVLLVSERSFVTLALRDELQRVGFEVVATDSVDKGVTQGLAFAERREAFFLVSDLILPDQAGIGWRGGLELLRALKASVPDLVALLVGEIRHASAAEVAWAAGATGYLTLPDFSQAPFEDVGIKVREFCIQLSSALCLSDQLSGIDWSAGAGAIRVSDPLSLLRGLIGELNAEGGSDVALLVLRLASEYFERAALFGVHDAKAVCRGAFGEPFNAQLRGAEIGLEDGSLLAQVVRSCEPCIGPIPAGSPNDALRGRLGEPLSREVALLPVSSGHDVFGVLYGDNATSGRDFGDLRALEIFLSQAGLSLQNALLRRCIETLTATDGAAWRTGTAA